MATHAPSLLSANSSPPTMTAPQSSLMSVSAVSAVSSSSHSPPMSQSSSTPSSSPPPLDMTFHNTGSRPFGTHALAKFLSEDTPSLDKSTSDESPPDVNTSVLDTQAVRVFVDHSSITNLSFSSCEQLEASGQLIEKLLEEASVLYLEVPSHRDYQSLEDFADGSEVLRDRKIELEWRLSSGVDRIIVCSGESEHKTTIADIVVISARTAIPGCFACAQIRGRSGPTNRLVPDGSVWVNGDTYDREPEPKRHADVRIEVVWHDRNDDINSALCKVKNDLESSGRSCTHLVVVIKKPTEMPSSSSKEKIAAQALADVAALHAQVAEQAGKLTVVPRDQDFDRIRGIAMTAARAAIAMAMPPAPAGETRREKFSRMANFWTSCENGDERLDLLNRPPPPALGQTLPADFPNGHVISGVAFRYPAPCIIYFPCGNPFTSGTIYPILPNHCLDILVPNNVALHNSPDLTTAGPVSIWYLDMNPIFDYVVKMTGLVTARQGAGGGGEDGGGGEGGGGEGGSGEGGGGEGGGGEGGSGEGGGGGGGSRGRGSRGRGGRGRGSRGSSGGSRGSRGSLGRSSRGGGGGGGGSGSGDSGSTNSPPSNDEYLQSVGIKTRSGLSSQRPFSFSSTSTRTSSSSSSSSSSSFLPSGFNTDDPAFSTTTSTSTAAPPTTTTSTTTTTTTTAAVAATTITTTTAAAPTMMTTTIASPAPTVAAAPAAAVTRSSDRKRKSETEDGRSSLRQKK